MTVTCSALLLGQPMSLILYLKTRGPLQILQPSLEATVRFIVRQSCHDLTSRTGALSHDWLSHSHSMSDDVLFNRSLSGHQSLYIQMEFCENKTVRDLILDRIFDNQVRAAL